MSKSKDAFRTISEVADWLETPAHVLRFWESKFTQVKPVKRAGGRRYYRPADMKLLGGIKKLLHDDGLTIKGAQKLLREHGVKHVADLSQPLEDDLLDEDEIAEAAYEPNAQPEPLEPEASTVLSFPNRAETSAEKPSVAATPVPEAPAVEPPAPTPEVEAPAAATSESIEPTATPPSAPEAPKSEPAATQTVTETATEEPEKGDEDEAPAFGTDALPAFLRRSSAPKEVAATLESEASPEKVAIDPVARFEPIEASEPEQEDAPEPSVAPAAASESPAPVQQPIFSHRGAATAPPDPEPEAKPEQISAATPPEPTPLAEPTEEAVQPKPALDVPPLSKVAPELSSYEAPAGVLAALPGSRRLAPDLAHQLGDKLGELRALRDRMQNH